MPEYAKDQPAGFKNAIERVAIVGAGGTIGSPIAAALLKTGKHTVTALTRQGSTNNLPSGITTAHVDYSDESTLVSALTNQQFLIITLSPTAPRDTQSKLIHAAAKAGVAYIMPNAYGPDIANATLGQDTFLGPPAQAAREEIERLGMHWVAICCGFWYDYSLAGGEARFGFDFAKKGVTFYDDGHTKISTSTLAQVARAVVAMVSLPVVPVDEADERVTLAGFLNRGVYFKSFVLSQREMFESVKRVTGTTDAEWTVTFEDTRKRYEEGLAQVKVGNMAGFGKLLYARTFYPDERSDLSDRTQNELLGLPEEDLDEATKAGVELVKELQLRADRMAH
ncbi:NAD(P)-binding protein [Aspergillus heterothallicus]